MFSGRHDEAEAGDRRYPHPLPAGSRIIFGVGAGWSQREFEAYSQWDEGRIRVKKTEEGVKLMLRLWTEDAVTFRGTYYSAIGAVVQPKPIQQPHPPLWFGSLGEYMWKLTARYGDGWLPWCTTTPELYAVKARTLRAEATKEGRQSRITYAGVIGQMTTPELGHFARHPSVIQWAETVEQYHQAGCEYALLYVHPPAYLPLLKRFTEEVAPSF